jgi:hypothetical protein
MRSTTLILCSATTIETGLCRDCSSLFLTSFKAPRVEGGTKRPSHSQRESSPERSITARALFDILVSGMEGRASAIALSISALYLKVKADDRCASRLRASLLSPFLLTATVGTTSMPRIASIFFLSILMPLVRASSIILRSSVNGRPISASSSERSRALLRFLASATCRMPSVLP